jgi:pimeloyl-ACP methyl ester carboxylesterase
VNRPAIRFSDLRGIGRLAGDATSSITDLVEAMHHTIVRTPGVFGKSPAGRTRGITGLVYGTIRGVTRLVGGGIDALLGRLDALVGERPSSPERDAVLAALNGVLGDYLESSGNPLATPMRLRSAGTPLALSKAALAAAFPQPARHVLVLVHGLCMNDLQWARRGHDHGAALARDLGCTPVYLHYNTGRHISANGRDFAGLMAELSREWPCPIEQLTIVGHSMGGLVARSACHYAALEGHAWVKRLDRMVFLGTPHLGSPIERAGTRADFLIELSPYSAPFARLGKVRSAGIKDLGHADLRDEDWQSAAPARTRRASVPLPAGVRCYAMAASKQERPSPSGARPRSDGLVPVDSALGRDGNAARDLGLPATRRWVGYGMGHFDLLDRNEAYEQLRGCIAGGDDRA